MPELPDVEGFRRVLADCARGRTVERVEVADPGVVRDVSPRRLAGQLEGRRFAEPRRHGKWLLGRTDGPTLLLHFGMTGRLACCAPDEPRQAHDRVMFDLDDGHQLRFRDQRKLRGIWLADSDDDVDRVLGDQGPDALEVRGPELARLLSERRRAVKPLLMDQSVLAGLGNILADEILWQARIHPARRSDRLTGDQRRRLESALRRVLRESVRAGHVPTGRDWLTGRRDQADAVCPRCGGPLEHGRSGGRSTVWCPHCQPEDA